MSDTFRWGYALGSHATLTPEEYQKLKNEVFKDNENGRPYHKGLVTAFLSGHPTDGYSHSLVVALTRSIKAFTTDYSITAVTEDTITDKEFAIINTVLDELDIPDENVGYGIVTFSGKS